LSKSERSANRAGSIFYWYFPARLLPSIAPLVIWLQGGPGCGSEIAIFKEHGPYRLDPLAQGNPVRNKWSWNTIANMVYVDHPVGTGWSTAPKSRRKKQTRYNKTEEDMAKNFYIFLEGFLEKFPDLQGRDLYIAGESYAGHFLPNIAAQLNIKRNKSMNLKGLIIGNGMLNPVLQYYSVFNFSKHHNLFHGLSPSKP
jgi:carboxypeptidase C (cathepsin A)